jgi:hypothetical protein
MARRLPPRDAKGRFKARSPRRRRNLDFYTDDEGRRHPIRRTAGYSEVKAGEVKTRGLGKLKRRMRAAGRA